MRNDSPFQLRGSTVRYLRGQVTRLEEKLAEAHAELSVAKAALSAAEAEEARQSPDDKRKHK